MNIAALSTSARINVARSGVFVSYLILRKQPGNAGVFFARMGWSALETV